MSDRPLNSGPPEIRSDEIIYQQQIGGGCFGSVYRGLCRGKEVAIKKLFKQDMDPSTLATFQKEVDLCSRLHHPNVVLFMGACTERQHMCIVTELMPKGNFEVLLKNPKEPSLSLFRRMIYAKDAALGMNWLHLSIPQIIHRDLKPSNLLLDENFRVKVCDFGLSDVKPYGKKLMDTECIPGTPLYMAPEVMLGQPFDEKSDVYSFGLTLWVILTKKDLFPDATNFLEFRKAITRDILRPTIPHDCLPSLRRLIERCWDASSVARPSFTEIISILDDIIVDAAIPDENARDVWKRRFPGGRTSVTLSEFLGAFWTPLGVEPLPQLAAKREEYLTLERVFSVTTNSEPAPVVPIERFGNMLAFFGPLEPRATVQRMVATLRHPAFFGEISKTEAEQKLARGKKGWYLIRLSTTQAGSFTISKLGKNSQISHQRIEYLPGKGLVFVNKEGKKETYHDWVALLKKVKNCSVPCPGSPFEYIFVKEIATGGYQVQDDA